MAFVPSFGQEKALFVKNSVCLFSEIATDHGISLLCFLEEEVILAV